MLFAPVCLVTVLTKKSVVASTICSVANVSKLAPVTEVSGSTEGVRALAYVYNVLFYSCCHIPVNRMHNVLKIVCKVI